ncbi:hypothetical protein A374_15808 [Fictibacillus macauensis ZFHKF-1]|uniref:Uncharacterized protein n=1 Tax=Fictibacillus macauensis ZFHKF-1 TaxID=1196324 RepID=I8IXQ1_9BACL|nr:hypothetical protein [Fictibacillus macauensis]EIT84266.1 hypothetical protein A374_15808 [Fictibacillus macauensis ZFHKF-1]
MRTFVEAWNVLKHNKRLVWGPIFVLMITGVCLLLGLTVFLDLQGLENNLIDFSVTMDWETFLEQSGIENMLLIVFLLLWIGITVFSISGMLAMAQQAIDHNRGVLWRYFSGGVYYFSRISFLVITFFLLSGAALYGLFYGLIAYIPVMLVLMVLVVSVLLLLLIMAVIGVVSEDVSLIEVCKRGFRVKWQGYVLGLGMFVVMGVFNALVEFLFLYSFVLASVGFVLYLVLTTYFNVWIIVLYRHYKR